MEDLKVLEEFKSKVHCFSVANRACVLEWYNKEKSTISFEPLSILSSTQPCGFELKPLIVCLLPSCVHGSQKSSLPFGKSRVSQPV